LDDRRLLQSDDGAERKHVAKIADEFFEGSLSQLRQYVLSAAEGQNAAQS